MTKSNKLKKIIKFAVERGWNDTILSDRKEWGDTDWKLFAEGSSEFPVLPCIIFLFSHDFAKAVFGKEEYSIKGRETKQQFLERAKVLAKVYPTNEYWKDRKGHLKVWKATKKLKLWQYHLQQIVLLEPEKIIDYYYKYVKEK